MSEPTNVVPFHGSNVVSLDRARILREDADRNRRLREFGDRLDITTSGELLRALGEGDGGGDAA